MPSDPTRPGGPRYTPVQRRLLTALAGLIVAALAGGAFTLTYDALRELALAGRAGERWAPLYPVMADTLTVLTILSLVITRNARWWTRLLRWGLLLLLVAGGAALSVQYSVWGYGALPEDAVRAGVAVAPHVMLVIAVWLWLTMFKQIRVARPGAEEITPPDLQRGHVKVLEPATPEPLALEAPAEDAEAATPPPAFQDDPEPEPLIPFLEPDPVPDTPPAYEPTRHETTDQEPLQTAPVNDEQDPTMETPPTRESTTREESTAGESEPEEPAAREAAAREEFGGGGSLSSEPAPPLDALPEPRPSLDPLPEPVPGPPALLPTDVELVRSRERAGTREQRPLAATTRPDIPMPAVFGADEEEHDIPPSDRAEDPDAGDHPAAEGGARAGGEPEDDWNPPPSSSFRSGPTPPVD